MEPYIGITDFMHGDQVVSMFAVFVRHLRQESERKLHIGVMMSRKTLLGLPSNWTGAFPPKEDVAGIFCSDETYNCLHYIDYDGKPQFWKDLTRAIGYGGIGIHAVQLDMVWPEPDQILNAVHASRKQLEVILQLNSSSLDLVRNDPRRLVDELSEYDGVIHRVLLDMSMGRGLPMDAPRLIPFLQAIRNTFPNMGLGVAGGLGPETMHLVKPITELCPDISIDAQGRLRPSGSALDPVDWDMAGEYLKQALAILP